MFLTKKEMQKESTVDLAEDIEANLKMILAENEQLISRIDFGQVSEIIPYIQTANRIFIIGAGRTGLALKAAAMRLMHLGFTVYVTGEIVTPAITKGDLLIAGSGSGTTGSIVSAAEKAVKAGAKVVAISTTKQSPLATLSNHVTVIPAAQKQDHGSALSQQYAGSLFEQCVLILTDAIIQTLWKMDRTPAEELWKRHANLE